MANETAIAIAATEARRYAEEAGPDLEDRLRAAMGKTYRHWMATDEDDQFKAALLAVIEVVDEDEKERLMATLRMMNTFGAAVAGVPVDFEAAFSEDGPEPVPVVRLWDEAKAGT